MSDELITVPEDPMAYMGHTPQQREWLLRMVRLYREVWHKPFSTARAETLSRMANRAREYKDRGQANPVACVIHKSRQLWEAGQEFLGQNCSLSSLMSAGMFETVFEAEKPAKVKRQEAEKRRADRSERLLVEMERDALRREAETLRRLREDPDAFEARARRQAKFHARARRGLRAEPTGEEVEAARERLRETLDGQGTQGDRDPKDVKVPVPLHPLPPPATESATP